MRHILAKRHLTTLAHFASSNVVLAFDYDGTLASITSEPARARLRAGTQRLLIAVAHRYPCVVISGRGRDDLTKRLEDIPVWHVFGNHGLEPWDQDPAYVKQVHEWVDHLERRLRSYPGLIIEDKTYSVAIHYRCVRHKRGVRKAINDAVLGLHGSRALGGKQAVNLVPRDAPHKGMALEWRDGSWRATVRSMWATMTRTKTHLGWIMRRPWARRCRRSLTASSLPASAERRGRLIRLRHADGYQTAGANFR